MHRTVSCAIELVPKAEAHSASMMFVNKGIINACLSLSIILLGCCCAVDPRVEVTGKCCLLRCFPGGAISSTGIQKASKVYRLLC